MELHLKSRVVIIMRGVPGSGKSTCSAALMNYLSQIKGMPSANMSLCSADHSMVNKKGDYHFILLTWLLETIYTL